MPVENNKNEQTSWEDILPRSRSACGLEFELQIAKDMENHQPKARVTRNQEVSTVEKTGNKRQHIGLLLGK